MSRLPNVGGDTGNWGTILNDYLSVEHNADGTQKNDTNTQRIKVSKSGTPVGTRQELNLIQGSNVTITAADDSANNRVNVTITGTGSGSTTLAGDSDVSISSPANGNVLTYDSTASNWQNKPPAVSSVNGQTGAVSVAVPYIGSSFPSSPSDGDVWIQTSPGGGVTPQLSNGFESGNVSGWDWTNGSPTVSTAYAARGTYGCRITGATSDSVNWSTSVPTGKTWAAFRIRFRIVQSASSLGIVTIQNNSGTDHFDVFVNSTGQLAADLHGATDYIYLDDSPAIGVWHLLEGRVYFGSSTYTAYLRYDYQLMPTLSASITETATTVKSLNAGSGSTTSGVHDIDDIALYVGTSDPGFLDAQPSVVRTYRSGKWIYDALSSSGVDIGADTKDAVAAAPAYIRYNTGTSSWPVRTTATTDSTRTVIWIGPTAPTIGGTGAINDVDVWWKTP